MRGSQVAVVMVVAGVLVSCASSQQDLWKGVNVSELVSRQAVSRKAPQNCANRLTCLALCDEDAGEACIRAAAFLDNEDPKRAMGLRLGGCTLDGFHSAQCCIDAAEQRAAGHPREKDATLTPARNQALLDATLRNCTDYCNDLMDIESMPWRKPYVKDALPHLEQICLERIALLTVPNDLALEHVRVCNRLHVASSCEWTKEHSREVAVAFEAKRADDARASAQIAAAKQDSAAAAEAARKRREAPAPDTRVQTLLAQLEQLRAQRALAQQDFDSAAGDRSASVFGGNAARKDSSGKPSGPELPQYGHAQSGSSKILQQNAQRKLEAIDSEMRRIVGEIEKLQH